MPSKTQFYAQLAAETARGLTDSLQTWTAFLETSARLYKYPYYEQLLIFAQKPEATACAGYEVWNETMNRYIRRGTKGIALIDSSGDAPRMKYVFDVSDTGGGANARRPFLWEYRPEHQDSVTAALEQRFGQSGSISLAFQLEAIAGELIESYWEEHQRDILGIVDGSFLEEYLLQKGLITMNKKVRLRPLYLFKILCECTDENHPLSTNEIVRLLKENYGIETQRTRISQDIESLEQFGYEIGRYKSQSNSYYFDRRLFELPELKLLIDAVESSSFITEKKSAELIQKLTSLASPYKASTLAKISEVGGNPKQGNEQIYYIIDTINAAIESGCKISYQYYTYNIFKNRVLRHNGEKYAFSPYDLAWDGKFYYAIGYSEKYHSISNIRIDRIAHTPEIMPEPGHLIPEGFDLNEYKRTMFRMYNSERMTVELVCDASAMDAIIDHFGEDVDIGLVDENTFSVSAETAVSHVFYSWLFGFGGKVRLTEPREAVEQYADMVLEAAKSLHAQL